MKNGDPAKTYEASAATKCLHFGMVEPKGVALAQQVRGDTAKKNKGPPSVTSKAFGYLRLPFTGVMD